MERRLDLQPRTPEITLKLGAHPLVVGITAVFLALLISAIVFPVFAGSGRGRRHPMCLTNVKLMSLALIMYESDCDELPYRDYWYSGIQTPYLKASNPNQFQCPVLRESKSTSLGYAFNGALSRKSLKKQDHPEKVPMIYDSVNPTENASDLMTSLPSPGRHKGRNTIGFADGHAKSLPGPVTR